MRIGIPKETLPDERRVAATPDTAAKLIKLGFEVVIESTAGQMAHFTDEAYQQAGAVIADKDKTWSSDIILKVNPPQSSTDQFNEVALLTENSTLVCTLWPNQNTALVEQLNSKNINLLAMDAVPRISRAQSLDTLSSMANIAGYRAVIEAAHQFGRFFAGQITAAGNISPAKVFVIGAGVAGLAAIGAANSLGAIVRAFDVRPEVKEQVESMGADYLVVENPVQVEQSSDGYAREMSNDFQQKAAELYAKQAKEVDIIITTALIPGKPAPKLITEEMISTMKPGSVIVDLAAANGGNCSYTVADELVTTDNGVHIIGYTDLASRLAGQSSTLYGNNIHNLVKLLCKNNPGNIEIDFDDVVLRSMTVAKEGTLTWPAPPIQVSAQPTPKQSTATLTDAPAAAQPNRKKHIPILAAAAAYAWISWHAPMEFLQHFTVFILACIIGYYVIWNVTHALHTPLMSVTNAISGIIILGAMQQIGQGSLLLSVLSFMAVLAASINIFGGFKVTKRMLDMFQKK